MFYEEREKMENEMNTQPEALSAYVTTLPEAIGVIDRLQAENERLKTIINSRPAINAGLPETYIEWSQSIYAMDHAQTNEVMQ